MLSDISWIKQGGPMMVPLLVLAFVGLVFFIERILFLHKGQIRAVAFMVGLRNLIRKRRILEAITVCQETPGPVAEVIKAVLVCHDQSESSMRTQAQDMALLQIPPLERRVGSLTLVGKLAPLCGLLGVIWAVMDGFFKMMEAGPYAYASLFAQQVSAGCISLATGIVIGMLAIIGHHILQGRVKALIYDMEWAANKIIRLLVYPALAGEDTQEATSAS
ncbi:MAG TPA: MotA/TolQ/ExbB proton channel family protein [Opitutales bacterium]|nr:MotA/TolQ/ExbB proton channel family protein [Opitutales bacterium]